jgi:hypothetical protein
MQLPSFKIWPLHFSVLSIRNDFVRIRIIPEKEAKKIMHKFKCRVGTKYEFSQTF